MCVDRTVRHTNTDGIQFGLCLTVRTQMEYLGRLSLKWDELANYKPPPSCTCGASEQITQDIEKERVHQFLMGLDEARFGHVCTNIIGLDPLPDIDLVYQRVVREERRLNTSRVGSRQDAVGFVARSELFGQTMTKLQCEDL
ncbi:hypothetical protein V5N11_010728 [Cardamine amara subsp. amara]|uniref:Uncharacterized protein n=1 Tax=Cardamine amara subsp. amara TaxID=228776 RepID=A0ABD0ZMD5_CARAN